MTNHVVQLQICPCPRFCNVSGVPLVSYLVVSLFHLCKLVHNHGKESGISPLCDTFSLWPHGSEELGLFLDHINSIRPSIQFTMEVETMERFPFLMY